jgi:hypothetical protein
MRNNSIRLQVLATDVFSFNVAKPARAAILKHSATAFPPNDLKISTRESKN